MPTKIQNLNMGLAKWWCLSNLQVVGNVHGGFSFPFETLERIEQFRLTLRFNESLRMVKQ